MNQVQPRVVAGAAAELLGRGCKPTVAVASGMSSANAKVTEGSRNPDRDAQFGYLNEIAAPFIADERDQWQHAALYRSPRPNVPHVVQRRIDPPTPDVPVEGGISSIGEALADHHA